MAGKLPKRLIKDKLSVDEAIAIQLEIEEEQLQEWRKNWEKIRKQQVQPTEKTSTKSTTAKTSNKTTTTKPAVKKPVPTTPTIVATKQTPAKALSGKAAILKTKKITA
jgi:hypothetical protein